MVTENDPIIPMKSSLEVLPWSQERECALSLQGKCTVIAEMTNFATNSKLIKSRQSCFPGATNLKQELDRKSSSLIDFEMIPLFRRR